MTARAAVGATTSLGFVCPRCRGPLGGDASAYTCERCAAQFPVVRGIPDFRVFPDPWIGLVDDREKARALEDRTRGASLEAMVRAYWAMTPATPASQANRFVEHVMQAETRSRDWIGCLPPTGEGKVGATAGWLDVGTGTGDLAVVAAERGEAVVAIDVAMRWLVVARRRAALAGVAVDFVCCNAEYLPFADRTFSRALALGTLEHLSDASRMLHETRRVLRRGGDLHVRTVNRYSALPEPHVGVWGVGYVPRRLADRYVSWRSGQRYEHHRPLSARELRGAFRSAGFTRVVVDAAPMLSSERAKLARHPWIADAYERSRRVPVARSAVRMVAPLLEASGVAS